MGEVGSGVSWKLQEKPPTTDRLKKYFLLDYRPWGYPAQDQDRVPPSPYPGTFRAGNATDRLRLNFREQLLDKIKHDDKERKVNLKTNFTHWVHASTNQCLPHQEVELSPDQGNHMSFRFLLVWGSGGVNSCGVWRALGAAKTVYSFP